jgi:hypothetical protein
LIEVVEFYYSDRQALRMREGGRSGQRKSTAISGAMQRESRQQHKGKLDMAKQVARWVQAEKGVST